MTVLSYNRARYLSLALLWPSHLRLQASIEDYGILKVLRGKPFMGGRLEYRNHNLDVSRFVRDHRSAHDLLDLPHQPGASPVPHNARERPCSSRNAILSAVLSSDEPLSPSCAEIHLGPMCQC